MMHVHKVASTLQVVGRKLFGRYLFVTNSVICGTLMGAGDVTAQFIERPSLRVAQFDFDRSGRYTLFGFCMGPLNHIWYKFLDKKYPLCNTKSIFRKILLDQTIAGPFVILALFIGLGFIERRTFDQTVKDARSNFLTIYKFDLCTWPLAQVINFMFVPAPYRVLYVSGVTYCWNTFLAYYKHNYVNNDKQLSLTDSTSTFFGSEGAKFFPVVHFGDMPEDETFVTNQRTKDIVKKLKM